MNTPKSILLVDANHLLHRILFVPSLLGLETKYGKKYGGVFGFLNSLQYTLNKDIIHRCIAVWDGGKSKRRLGMYESYKKSNVPYVRGEDPDKDEHLDMFALCRSYLFKLLPELGVPCIRFADREGDDVLYTARQLALEDGFESCGILSEDRDFFQVVDQRTYLHQPIKNVTITERNFVEEAGLPRDRYLFFRVLSGDASDNITGIPGVGPKTAMKVALDSPLEYDALREFCAVHEDRRVRKVADNLDIVERNYRLMTLGLEEFEENELGQIKKYVSESIGGNLSDATRLLTQMEFQRILKRFYEWSIPFKRLGAS
jgi:DNA polymerase-1